MSASPEARDAPGQGQPHGGLDAVRLELRRRAAVKQARASKIATMRLAGLPLKANGGRQFGLAYPGVAKRTPRDRG